MAGDIRLSPRERQVFELISEGMNQREIAQHLGISRSTVSVHIGRIAEKLPDRDGRSPMRSLLRLALTDGVPLQVGTSQRIRSAPYRGEGGVVYFIRAVESGRIKIGHTKGSAEARLTNFLTGSPEPLELLGAVPQTDDLNEPGLHERFADARRHGEWFEPTEDLLQFIEECVRATAESGVTSSQ